MLNPHNFKCYEDSIIVKPVIEKVKNGVLLPDQAISELPYKSTTTHQVICISDKLKKSGVDLNEGEYVRLRTDYGAFAPIVINNELYFNVQLIQVSASVPEPVLEKETIVKKLDLFIP